MKKFFFTLLLGLYSIIMCAMQKNNDTSVKKMPLEDKVAMLIMPRFDAHTGQEMLDLLQKYTFGSILLQGNYSQEQQLEIIQHIKKISKNTDILCAQHMECGTDAHIIDGIKLPYPSAMNGFTSNKSKRLTYQYGYLTGLFARNLMIDWVLEPVGNSNTDSNNILDRSQFSSDSLMTSDMSSFYIDGLIKAGVLSCIKHFPYFVFNDNELSVMGNGLPQLAKNIVPFKKAITQNVDAIMMSTASIAFFDKLPIPATLSRSTILGHLRSKLCFKNLILTDSLSKKSLQNFGAGVMEIHALKAGADILVDPAKIESAIESICNAVKFGALSEEKINQSVIRLLDSRYKMLERRKITIHKSSNELLSWARTVSYKIFIRAISQEIIDATVDNLIVNPIPIVYVGAVTPGSLMSLPLFLEKYGIFAMPHRIYSLEDLEEVPTYNLCVVIPYGLNTSIEHQFGFSDHLKMLLDAVSKRQKNTILCLFTSPDAKKFYNVSNFSKIIYAYEPHSIAIEIVAGIIAHKTFSKSHVPF